MKERDRESRERALRARDGESACFALWRLKRAHGESIPGLSSAAAAVALLLLLLLLCCGGGARRSEREGERAREEN